MAIQTNKTLSDIAGKKTLSSTVGKKTLSSIAGKPPKEANFTLTEGQGQFETRRASTTQAGGISLSGNQVTLNQEQFGKTGAKTTTTNVPDVGSLFKVPGGGLGIRTEQGFLQLDSLKFLGGNRDLPNFGFGTNFGGTPEEAERIHAFARTPEGTGLKDFEIFEALGIKVDKRFDKFSQVQSKAVSDILKELGIDASTLGEFDPGSVREAINAGLFTTGSSADIEAFRAGTATPFEQTIEKTQQPIVPGETLDNQITNSLVDRGLLPESERENVPQKGTFATATATGSGGLTEQQQIDFLVQSQGLTAEAAIGTIRSLESQGRDFLNAFPQAAETDLDSTVISAKEPERGLKIPNIDILNQLASQGLTEKDIERVGGDIFLKPGSKFDIPLGLLGQAKEGEKKKQQAADEINRTAEETLSEGSTTDIDVRGDIVSDIISDVSTPDVVGGVTRPEVPSLVDLFNEKKAELGIEPLEDELARIDNDIEAINANLLIEAEKAGEALVSTRTISRKRGSLQLAAERQIALLNIERSGTARLLTNKLNSLEMIMNLTQQDFANASALYSQEFNRQIQVANLIGKQEDRQISEAKANLNTIMNLATASGKSFSDLTPDQQRQINQLEIQAGFASGTMATFMENKPKVNILSTTSGTDAQGNGVVTFIYEDPETGLPGTVEVISTGTQKTITGGGGGGTGGGGTTGGTTGGGTETATSQISFEEFVAQKEEAAQQSFVDREQFREEYNEILRQIDIQWSEAQIEGELIIGKQAGFSFLQKVIDGNPNITSEEAWIIGRSRTQLTIPDVNSLIARNNLDSSESDPLGGSGGLNYNEF